MKKLLLLITATFLSFQSKSQTVVEDTVATGAGYANQVWYSLANDEQKSDPKTNWDLAFDLGGTSGIEGSIHINTIAGTLLWVYSTDTSTWDLPVDTTGIAGWTALYNSDKSWHLGAFDAVKDPSDELDFGWGAYNFLNHNIVATKYYVIKLATGKYQKIQIQILKSGSYYFKYADLDGANEVVAKVEKAPYKGKNLVYYSIQKGEVLDREPLTADWDFLFTQYHTDYPGFGAYPVTGVLSNDGVTIAKVTGVADKETYVEYQSQTFGEDINIFGYDWKTFNLAENKYYIKDSLVFFVQTNAGDIWKVIPRGFGGSATGGFIFTKEKLATVGVKDLNDNQLSKFTVYPNLLSGGNDVHVIYELSNNAQSANVRIFGLNGALISSEKVNATQGFYNHSLKTGTLQPGTYLISLEINGYHSVQKIVVQ